VTRLKRSSLVFILGSAIATGWVFAYSFFFNTPKEMSLLKERYSLLASYDLILAKLEDTENTLNKISERDNKVYRAVFEEDTIPYTIRNAGFGGVDRYAKYENLGISASPLLVDLFQKVDVLQKKAYIQSKSFDRIAELASNKTLMQQSMPIAAPVDLSKTRLSSEFGNRRHPVFGGIRFHEGIDLTGSTGTPIYSTGDGVVVRALLASGYGNLVEIDHGFGYVTRYGHLSKFNVKAGDKVKRGDKIGEMGSTGVSIGPHLHYEVILKSVPRNPTLYFENVFDSEEYVFVDQGDGVSYED